MAVRDFHCFTFLSQPSLAPFVSRMLLFPATLLAAIIKNPRWFAVHPSGFLNWCVMDHDYRYLPLARVVFLGYRFWRLALLVVVHGLRRRDADGEHHAAVLVDQNVAVH